MKNRKLPPCRLWLTVLLLLFASLLLFGCRTPEEERDYTVRVLLPEGGDYHYGGAQIMEDGEPVGEIQDTRAVNVRPGQSVRFLITLRPLAIIEGLKSNMTYKDGYLTVENVRTPTTVPLRVRQLQHYTVMTFSNKNHDALTSSAGGKTSLLENTEVTLSVSPIRNQTFLGFSSGATIENGGTLLTDQMTYTFHVKNHAAIYANWGSTLSWRLTYHANGGTVAAGVDPNDIVTDSFYLCPNTRPDKGFYTREGYVLTGYNTAPDGSGTYYGLGWNVVMPASNHIDLYCVWEKAAPASSFVCSQNSDGSVSITGYTGKQDFLVIPEKINGKPVTRIAGRAFNGATFTEVYIPRTVLTVEKEAFYNCKQLKKVNFSDSVKVCYNDSFKGCTAFKTLAPQATQYPHFASTTNSTYAINFERLITCTGPKLVVISGSTNVYGLTSMDLQKGLGDKWEVITFASIASSPNTIYTELASYYLTKDDVVILSPEPVASQWGGTDWRHGSWQISECAYDAIALLDISVHNNVFGAYTDHATSRDKTSEKNYELYNQNLNEYGENIQKRETRKQGNASVSYSTSYFSDANVTRLNTMLDKCAATGATVMLGFTASTNRDGIVRDSSENGKPALTAGQKATINTFMEQARAKYHAHFYASAFDYIYDPSYFFDSHHHVTTAGCEMRTAQMTADIKAALQQLGRLPKEN